MKQVFQQLDKHCREILLSDWLTKLLISGNSQFVFYKHSVLNLQLV